MPFSPQTSLWTNSGFTPAVFVDHVTLNVVPISIVTTRPFSLRNNLVCRPTNLVNYRNIKVTWQKYGDVVCPLWRIENQILTRNIGARTKVMGQRNFQESIIVSINKTCYGILIGQCEINRRVSAVWYFCSKLESPGYYDAFLQQCIMTLMLLSIPTAVFPDSGVMKHSYSSVLWSGVMKHSYSSVSWLWYHEAFLQQCFMIRCYEAFLQRCFLTLVLWSIPTAVFHDSDVMKHSYSGVLWLWCYEAFLQQRI